MIEMCNIYPCFYIHFWIQAFHTRKFSTKTILYIIDIDIDIDFDNVRILMLHFFC